MTLEKDKEIVRLFCSKCENPNCIFYDKILGYVYEGSKKGCSRKINEDIADKYYHYMQEITPCWKNLNSFSLINEQYNEILNFLNKEIYKAPVVNLYNHKGKVSFNKKEIIKKFQEIRKREKIERSFSSLVLAEEKTFVLDKTKKGDFKNAIYYLCSNGFSFDKNL